MTAEMPTVAPAPAETVRLRPVRLWFIACSIAAVGCAAATARLSSASAAYDAGAANLNPPFILTAGEVRWLVAWGVSAVVLIAASFMRRSAARHFARRALLVCIAAVPLSCEWRPSPETRYEDGFLDWARSHVEADPIRNWEASRAAVAAAPPIPAAQWPAAVASLSPDNVTELPGKRGLVLEWGQLAAWGTSRRVFIAADPSIAPPSEDEYIHFAWRLTGSGAYAAFQDRS
jgi:hypothetical protein